LLFARVQTAVKGKKFVSTQVIGGDQSEIFNEVPENGAILVGFNLTLRQAGTGRRLSSIQPIFLSPEGVTTGATYGREEDEAVTVQAREGYAVAAVTLRGRYQVEGIVVGFAKIARTGLSPKDVYTSELYGYGGGNARSLSGGGKVIVGVVGRSNEFQLEALGLVHLVR
jgi:hypothetical protein